MDTIATVVLIASGFACCSAAAYRVWWRRRYGAPPPWGSGAARVAGWITAVRGGDDQPCSFELQTADRVRHTVAADRSVALDALAAGERVTVEGIPRAVQRVAAEELYREAACVPGIDATRIARGAWPALRWSVPAMAVLAALATVALAVGVVTRPAQERIVEETAAKTSCPHGTARETRVGPDGVLHRCRDAQGRLHGAYTMWNWTGALVERGNYWRGAREGARDVLRRGVDSWVLQRTTYRRGRRHGPSYELLDPEGAQIKRYQAEFVNGVLHGTVRSWHDDGSPDFAGEYRCGQPCGKHTHWILSDTDADQQWSRPFTGAQQQWSRPFDDSAALPSCDDHEAGCGRELGPLAAAHVDP